MHVVNMNTDYGNAMLYGLLGNQIDSLQSVMNAAARLVFSALKYEHVTPLLRDLHWLRVPERIEFKLAVVDWYASCTLDLAWPSTESTA